MLITGLGAKVAAVALAAFTIAAGVIFHDFWAADATQYMNQFNHFMKNLAVVGGLLVAGVAAVGGRSVQLLKLPSPAGTQSRRQA